MSSNEKTVAIPVESNEDVKRYWEQKWSTEENEPDDSDGIIAEIINDVTHYEGKRTR